MPGNRTEEDPNLELVIPLQPSLYHRNYAKALQELKRLQTVRASFEILKRYTDVIAASVEGTLDNFTAVNDYAKRLEGLVETVKKEGEGGKGMGKGKDKNEDKDKEKERK